MKKIRGRTSEHNPNSHKYPLGTVIKKTSKKNKYLVVVLRKLEDAVEFEHVAQAL